MKLFRIWLERFFSCSHIDKAGDRCLRCRWHELPHVSEHRIWTVSGGGTKPLKVFSKNSVWGIK